MTQSEGLVDLGLPLPKIAITGASGFVGWHLRCFLAAHGFPQPVEISIRPGVHPSEIRRQLAGCDAVIHLAGVNRSESEDDFWTGNQDSMTILIEAFGLLDTSPILVNANSVHSLDRDDVYARSKSSASRLARAWAEKNDGIHVDILLPNLFGEHGQPNYNSVVATFCHQLVSGVTPSVIEDRSFELLHVQQACKILVQACQASSSMNVRPSGRQVSVSDLLWALTSIADKYKEGHLPNLADSFTRALFNTYRSFAFPGGWPIRPMVHADDRGVLFEAVRAEGGETQAFCSVTLPGKSRGNHFHLFKTERFMVLQGQASIRLRRMFTSEVVEFQVDGSEPVFIDMPTMWTHSITNTGDRELLTLFYADDQYNPEDPDTYWIEV